jgi:hypothetical protein
MTFSEQMQDDLSVFVNPNEFGTSLTYYDLQLVATSCNVIIKRDVMIQPSSYDAQVVEAGTTITALYADIGEPDAGSQFKTADKIYTVKRITDNDRIFVTMVVTDEDRH